MGGRKKEEDKTTTLVYLVSGATGTSPLPATPVKFSAGGTKPLLPVYLTIQTNKHPSYKIYGGVK